MAALTAGMLGACDSGFSDVETGNAVTPGDGANYAPVTVGNRWTYRSSLDGSVTQIRVAPSRVSATGVQMIVDARETPASYAKTADALLVEDATSLHGELGLLETLQFPVTVGDSFVQVDRAGLDAGWDADGDGRHETLAIHAEVFVLGFETLTVPAGRFADCAKVLTETRQALDYTRSGRQAVMLTHVVDWYAPGVGRVRRDLENVVGGVTLSSRYELVDYAVDGRRGSEASTVDVQRNPQAQNAREAGFGTAAAGTLGLPYSRPPQGLAPGLADLRLGLVSALDEPAPLAPIEAPDDPPFNAEAPEASSAGDLPATPAGDGGEAGDVQALGEGAGTDAGPEDERLDAADMTLALPDAAEAQAAGDAVERRRPAALAMTRPPAPTGAAALAALPAVGLLQPLLDLAASNAM